MQIQIRKLTGQSVACGIWLLSDGTVQAVRLTQAEYDKDPTINRPQLAVQFLMGAGGIPAIDTVDGWPSAGDAWEADDDGIRVLRVCLGGVGINFQYESLTAADPGKAQTSTATWLSAQAGGDVMTVPIAQLAKDATGYTMPDVSAAFTLTSDDLIIRQAPSVIVASGAKLVPNHKSVTFDATSSGSSLGTTLTIAHTAANQPNRHLSVGVAFTNGGGQTISGITWNTSEALTVGPTRDPALGRRVEIWSKLAPTATTANVVVTQTGAANDLTATVWSAYGAHQTTAYSNTASAYGTSTTPAVTVTSASGELVLVHLLSRNHNITPDATWTTDSNATGAAIRQSGAHKAGAASVTRTDTLAASGQWISVGASIQAAPAGGFFARYYYDQPMAVGI